VDVSLVIRQRLSELSLDQKELASAAQVTESYISQLLTRKKVPPAPGRTEIYDKIGQFLALPGGELSKLAEVQRQEEFKKRVAETPRPLFWEFRDLILRKCEPSMQGEIRRLFEKEAFGELERLVTQQLLDVAQGVARKGLQSEEWLRLLAQISDRDCEQMRVAALGLLEADVFDGSVDNCVSCLDSLIESWDIDLKTFSLDIVLNRRLAQGGLRRFEFREKVTEQPNVLEPGFEQFLRDQTLSRDITPEEIEFLKQLKFYGRRPSSLYYYRELQNLRDPLHFAAVEGSKESA
jgi:transcriptional regulator with XRE-family HTH domain